MNLDRTATYIVKKLMGLPGLCISVALLGVAAYAHDSCLVCSIFVAEFGAVLFSIVFLHWTYEKLKYHSYIAQTWEVLLRVLNISGSGITKYHKELSSKEISNRVGASRKLRVLKTWFPDEQDIWKAVRESFKSGADVTILLCHPMSTSLRDRGASIEPGERAPGHMNDQPQDYGRNLVIGVLNDFRGWLTDQSNPNVNVGLYLGWPSVPLVICDEIMYLGFYLRGKSSPHNPWFELSVNDGEFSEKLVNVYNLYHDDVNCLWVIKNGNLAGTWNDEGPVLNEINE